MKILQLIDTLHPGGAERVALNYANCLMKYGIESHLCVSREKGILVDEVDEGVKIHFLNKKSVFDLLALMRLRRIIKEHKIDIVHAHGSSWFFAVLSKNANLNFKLIWHDHYGNSEFLAKRNKALLSSFSRKFNGILSVNSKLRDWAQNNLYCKNVLFLNNFIKEGVEAINNKDFLKGQSKFKIICVANLRQQKDHTTLINAFRILTKEDNNISLHLFGKEYKDRYSKDILEEFKAIPSLFWYGEVKNIQSYLGQADVGVLSSKSEGLPLALLEYARAGLAVVCTDVGECRRVVGSFGKLVSSGDQISLAKAISFYMDNKKILEEDSINLKERIKQLYSEENIIPKYLSFCETIC